MTLSWACLYKDILCSFFLLLAFYLFLRYIETGERRFYVWQWVVFLLGFGAMETNAVYPAIALSFAVLCAPAHIRKAALLLIPSAIYLALNFLFVKKQADGPYAMHFDSFLPVNFLQYWVLVLKPDARLLADRWPMFVLPAIATVVLAGFIVWQWRAGRRLPVFFLLWFVFTIAPVLPLREQFQTYYATVASIGIAMLAADAISSAWASREVGVARRRNRARARIPHPVGATSPMPKRANGAPAANARSSSSWASSPPANCTRRRPSFSTASTARYSGTFFRTAGFARPMSSTCISLPARTGPSSRRPYFPDPSEFVIRRKHCSATRSTLACITPPATCCTRSRGRTSNALLATKSSELPRRVDVAASRSMESLLSGDWYPSDTTHRWMAKQAGIRLAGPQTAGESLHVLAVCPPEFLADGPRYSHGDRRWQAAAPRRHPRDGGGRLVARCRRNWWVSRAVQVTLEVSRTHTPPQDGRALGIAIRLVEIR